MDSQTGHEWREKIVVWGAGEKTKKFLSYYDFYDDIVEIIAVVDANKEKWGKNLGNYKIISPEKAYEMDYERFIVPSEKYFDEIADRIVSDTKIERSRIEHVYYITKCKLTARYKSHPDKADILSYIQDNPLDVFNYSFVKKYENIHPEIGYDENAELFYVMHKGYRMYMAKRFNTVEEVRTYYKSLCIEQDKDSPHLYLQADFDVGQGDVVVDIGAAEGIFTLDVIERAEKVYLIETSKEWIEALRYTFKNFQGKVEIINKYICDYTAYNTTTLDDLIHEDVDFIKMDIEGCEYAAMTGASALIERTPHIKCALCTYHNDNDEIMLRILAESLGLKVSLTKGYMFYPCSIQQIYIMPTLRKGVIRCEK